MHPVLLLSFEVTSIQKKRASKEPNIMNDLRMIFFKTTGAGDGIRAHDIQLGKREIALLFQCTKINDTQ
jgi:hypothetical protein